MSVPLVAFHSFQLRGYMTSVACVSVILAVVSRADRLPIWVVGPMIFACAVLAQYTLPTNLWFLAPLVLGLLAWGVLHRKTVLMFSNGVGNLAEPVCSASLIIAGVAMAAFVGRGRVQSSESEQYTIFSRHSARLTLSLAVPSVLLSAPFAAMMTKGVFPRNYLA